MSDDLTERLRGSDGFRVVRAQATFHRPTIVADTTLMREAADEIERLREALVDMAQDWCCLHHPDDTHVEVLMPVELFKEFRDG